MMDENENQPVGITGGMKVVTSVASIAAVIDGTARVLNEANGRGVSLTDDNGQPLTHEQIRNAISEQVYSRLNQEAGRIGVGSL